MRLWRRWIESAKKPLLRYVDRTRNILDIIVKLAKSIDTGACFLGKMQSILTAVAKVGRYYLLSEHFWFSIESLESIIITAFLFNFLVFHISNFILLSVALH
jgi:hypothetical protein